MVPIIITAAVTAVIVAVIVWFVATGIQQSKYKATVGSAEETMLLRPQKAKNARCFLRRRKKT